MSILGGIALTLAIAGAEMQAELDAELRAISAIESNDNDKAVGADGERGRYQLTFAVWRRHMGKESYSNAFKPNRAKACAILQLHDLKAKFRKRFNRYPSAQELYAMWRLGYAGLLRRGLHVPKSIKDSCERYENLYNVYRQNQ